MTKSKQLLGPLRLEPEYHKRVWGGHHLKPDSGDLIGEAWVVHEHNKVASGPLRGRTLAELAEEYGEELLGSRVVGATSSRFPLLIKLLDCADWLSLQVHPNDAQAVKLEGPGHFGKTEAWHVLGAEPGAQLISGLKPGTLPETLALAIRGGTVIELAQYLDVQRGDTLMTHAGTVHALGPGLLIYEVQQTSDITYRIYDWDRPQNAGRELHLAQSVAVADATRSGQVYRPERPLRDGEVHNLTCCDFFTLELLGAETQSIQLDTAGRTFHVLTVIEGRMRVSGEGWVEELALYDTLLLPASLGMYTVEPLTKFQALKASEEGMRTTEG